MEITVRIKTVYGTETIYPVCENAKRFAEIAGTKTLTRRTVDIIRAMDIPVAIAPQSWAARLLLAEEG